jgi:hypothetical protein
METQVPRVSHGASVALSGIAIDTSSTGQYGYFRDDDSGATHLSLSNPRTLIEGEVPFRFTRKGGSPAADVVNVTVTTKPGVTSYTSSFGLKPAAANVFTLAGDLRFQGHSSRVDLHPWQFRNNAVNVTTSFLLDGQHKRPNALVVGLQAELFLVAMEEPTNGARSHSRLTKTLQARSFGATLAKIINARRR